MKSKMLKLLGTFLGVVAVIVATPGSWTIIHNEEVPQELLK